MPITLTPKDRARLKAKAHALEPVVKVGDKGLTAGVVAEIERALKAHELIKIRAAGADREARVAMADEIVARTDAAVVQQVGKVLVVWRPRPEDEPE